MPETLGSGAAVIVTIALLAFTLIAYIYRKNIIDLSVNLREILVMNLKTGSYTRRKELDEPTANYDKPSPLSDSPKAPLRPSTGESINMIEKAVKTYQETSCCSGAINFVLSQRHNALREAIAGLPSQILPVSTRLLYETIVKFMQTDSKVSILDQDITRWIELVYREITIPFNTINYSRDIVHQNRESAKKIKDFELKRVFVLSDRDLKSFPGLVRFVLNWFELSFKPYKNQISTRVFIVRGNGLISLDDNRWLHEKIEKIKDVVILRDQCIMFRENISYRHRENPKNTVSEVIQEPNTISLSAEVFSDIYRSSMEIEDIFKEKGWAMDDMENLECQLDCSKPDWLENDSALLFKQEARDENHS